MATWNTWWRDFAACMARLLSKHTRNSRYTPHWINITLLFNKFTRFMTRRQCCPVVNDTIKHCVIVSQTSIIIQPVSSYIVKHVWPDRPHSSLPVRAGSTVSTIKESHWNVWMAQNVSTNEWMTAQLSWSVAKCKSTQKNGQRGPFGATSECFQARPASALGFNS